MAARSWRRSRFRTTAVPTFREIENATADSQSSASEPRGRNRQRRSRVRTCRPSANKRRNVARSEIPRIKQRSCGGPCAADSSGSRVRHESTCGSESRAFSPCGDCLAGTYASSSSPRVLRQTCGVRRVGHHTLSEKGHTRQSRPRENLSMLGARVAAIQHPPLSTNHRGPQSWGSNNPIRQLPDRRARVRTLSRSGRNSLRTELAKANRVART